MINVYELKKKRSYLMVRPLLFLSTDYTWWHCFFLTECFFISRGCRRFHGKAALFHSQLSAAPSVFIPKASTSVARAKTCLKSCLNSRWFTIFACCARGVTSSDLCYTRLRSRWLFLSTDYTDDTVSFSRSVLCLTQMTRITQITHRYTRVVGCDWYMVTINFIN